MLTLPMAYQMVQQYPMFGFVQLPSCRIVPFTWGDATSPFKGKHLDVMPGSFNPLHDGHRAIFDAIKNPDKTYELAIERVNKGGVTLDELQTRLNQFKGYAPILVLKHPLFIHKMGVLYPFRANFHIGIDTASRIIESHPSVEVQGMNADFIVYDRQMDGQIWGLKDLPEPRPKNFFEGERIAEALMAISSTAIRASASLKSTRTE